MWQVVVVCWSPSATLCKVFAEVQKSPSRLEHTGKSGDNSWPDLSIEQANTWLAHMAMCVKVCLRAHVTRWSLVSHTNHTIPLLWTTPDAFSATCGEGNRSEGLKYPISSFCAGLPVHTSSPYPHLRGCISSSSFCSVMSMVFSLKGHIEASCLQ